VKIAAPEHARRDEGVIRLQVAFPEDELGLRETPAGREVRLAGCYSNAGHAGEPALPRTTIHVALPEGAWPTKVDVGETRSVRITDEPTLVAPVQPLRPGVDDGPPDRKDDGDREPAELEAEKRLREPRDQQQDHEQQEREERRRLERPKPPVDEEVLAEPLPSPPYVPPDPDAYERAMREWQPVRPSGFAQLGRSPIVALELRPVRLTDEGHLELVTELEVTVAYGPRPRPRDEDRDEALKALAERGYADIDPARVVPLPEPKITSRAQAERLASLARDLVVNPDVIGDWVDIYPVLDLPADYLVITDNQTWDADSISPVASVGGDMVASFERIAAWKRSRGVTAKVVTVSDIVAGRYGDFLTGSRDLPEVIRRFLKWAHDHWGVAWLLVGGDVGVVPARVAAGAVEGHMNTTGDDPPGDNLSHWTGSFLKMHVVRPGTWWIGSWQPILTNPRTGQVIPFDSTGATASGGTGWYYTTDDTYTTRSTMATTFVRANGAAALLNERLQWLYEWNRIPTDLYYSSLTSWVLAYHEIDLWLFTITIPYVYVPPHDWDALDNGLYGQYVNGTDADGVVWQTDISVGRAPVQSVAEADAFVDKVIAYERFRAPNGLWLNGDWPRRLVIVADNWGGPVRVDPTASNPPGNNRFFAGATPTVLKLAEQPTDWDRQLIADISDSDRRELPYQPSGGSAQGWHYATSATNHAPPVITINFWFFSFTFPLTSQWIVVNGAADERNPRWYLFDHVLPDGSMVDQEQLREQLRVELPGWDQVSRLYKDETDLTPAQLAAAPLQHLTTDRVRAALDAGPHVVSLSGHGSGGGCCGANTGLAQALTNGWHSFIAYADSCLTNQVDANDAFSEELLQNASGGAVAYVGNTRFSWIGVGDDVQRRFFHRLTTTRHLGLANDSRLTALDFGYWHAYARWVMYALNLMGDPEMPIWRSGRARYPIEIDWPHRLDVPLKVLVREPKPGEPVERIVVHVRQGDREWAAHPDPDGTATFLLDPDGSEEVTVTVSAPDVVPTVEVLRATSPTWLTGTVTRISHRHDGRDETRVTLASDDGIRELLMPGDHADYEPVLSALVGAHLSGSAISLLVIGERGLGRIERFRFSSKDDAAG
jgi:Peptidase family C25